MTRFQNRARLGSALLLSGLLFALPPSPAQAVEPPGPAIGSYLAGRFAQHQDDWTAAALYMAQALAADPGDLALLRRTFLLKLGEGKIDNALELAQRVLQSDSDPQMALALLAADGLASGRLGDAEALAARIPADGLGKFIGPLTKAWLAQARGQTDNALAALEPLTQISGFAALHNLHAALILDLAGRTEQAAARYASVTESAAPLRVVQIVGNFMERTGRVAEARKLYETFRAGAADSLLVEPTVDALGGGATTARTVRDARDGLAEAMFDLASALHHENADETALLFGRLALHLRADLPLARLMIGDIMTMRDHHEEALAEYGFLAKNPILGWSARLRAADSLARLDRADEAIASLTALTAEHPERTDALIRLGDLQRFAKRYAEAAESYSAALTRMAPPDERQWPLLYARAMAYEKVGRWPETEADLKAALAVKPDEPSLLNHLGYSWIERGENLTVAKGMVERAVALRPRDGYIMDSLGWALFSLGDFNGAVDKLERAVEMKPLDPTINDHLGDAYWRVGRRNEARFQWTRALRIAEEDEQKDAIQAKLDKGLPDNPHAATVKR